MKSVLIIGMGAFGRYLAEKMQALGNDVMVVDRCPEIIDELSPIFSDAQIGDPTNELTIRDLGVSNFDIVFVTIGEDFHSSLVISLLLKRYGAKKVVAKAATEIQEELLKKIGVDEVIFPEREMAEKMAVRFNAENIFDFIQLTGEYSIYEIPVPPDWIGKTIADVAVRNKYRINIIAIKTGEVLSPIPGPAYVFSDVDQLVVIGKPNDVFKLSARK